MKKNTIIVMIGLLFIAMIVAVKFMSIEQTITGSPITAEDSGEESKEAKDSGEESKEAEDSVVEEVETETEVEYREPQEEETEVLLEGDILVGGFGKYIGSYVEDGTDEFVENVMKIVLENKGDTYIQLAHITINGQYVFEVTTLFPGERVMVLEKNRTPYDEGMKMTSVEIGNTAVFHEVPTMCEGILEITSEDHQVTVTNISGEEFSGGKIFYKRKLKDAYLGGITYYINIPRMEVGQQVGIASARFQKESHELLFVTYAE